MATQMIVRIDPGLKNKVSRLAKAEGKNLSELVRDLLVHYARERDMSATIDSLWERIGQDFSRNNVSEADIEETIRQVRSKNA
ncbi:MAG: ribbon-helix-helix protein, CopG family [Deltaproteobacteria bacterium]|nr:ribbon-helix-helix protein, CopG family [Candidatus Tharpellaceae bacterium]